MLRWRPMVIILALLVLAAGCAPQGGAIEAPPGSTAGTVQEAGEPAQPDMPVEPDVPVEPPEAIAPVDIAVSGPRGSGAVSYDDGVEPLAGAQEALLLEYMDLYYESLAKLTPGDPAPLFAGDAKDRAAARQGAWRTIIDVRRAQQVDLTLTAYTYELVVTDATAGDDGAVSISVNENAALNFTAFPGVDSETHNVRHRFTMAETAGGWRLRSHTQMDSMNMMALGSAMWREFRRDSGSAPTTPTDTGAALEERHDELLGSHLRNLDERKRQAAAYSPSAAPATDGAYDRQAAVEYAMAWVEDRNSDSWPSYDRNGGNCANYTSQCMLAGGIPMDYFGTSQWKWFGSTPNTAQAATGRSGAWSGVNEFYSYVTGNTGYGLVAEANANYAAGEPGDLIQLGYDDDWRHVVIITEVIRDGDGKAVDYLVNSNTADLRSYPVSAYIYPQHRLIKIYGWNGD